MTAPWIKGLVSGPRMTKDERAERRLTAQFKAEAEGNRDPRKMARLASKINTVRNRLNAIAPTVASLHDFVNRHAALVLDQEGNAKLITKEPK